MKKQDLYKTPAGQLYKVKVGGNKTTDDIVRQLRANGFDCVNKIITQKNFPLEPRPIKEIEMEIIDPGRPFTEKEGLVFLKNAGLKRPTLEHAIYFTEQCGTKTNGKYVVFLHEHWLATDSRRDLDNNFVLYLNRKSETFNMVNPKNGFGDECVLAGVRRAIK